MDHKSENDSAETGRDGVSMDCRLIRELMDMKETLSDSEQNRLDAHLKACPACTAEAHLEGLLREVIVPAELSAPSRSFEATLMKKLDLAPVMAAPRPNYLLRWGLVAGIIGVAVLLVQNMNPVLRAVYKSIMYLVGRGMDVLVFVDGAANRTVESITGQVDAHASTIFDQLTQISGVSGVMTLNLLLLSIVILGGVIAIGINNRS